MFVTVLDVNDNRPIFLQSSYEASVPEDIAEGHSIVQAGGGLCEQAALSSAQVHLLDGILADGNRGPGGPTALEQGGSWGWVS